MELNINRFSNLEDTTKKRSSGRASLDTLDSIKYNFVKETL